MARTRSVKAAPADAKASSANSGGSSSKYSLPPKTGNPSKLFILPKQATPEAQIVLLPHPRHKKPSRYLVCPKTGIYEFTQIAAPNTEPRSWLIETKIGPAEGKPESDAAEGTTDDEKLERHAEISAGSELYVATALDPLFLALPALADTLPGKNSEGKGRLFMSSDDHLDKLPEEASHLFEIMRCDETRKLIEKRMGAICDTVEACDTMFRLNEKKLLAAIQEKATKMAKGGLPASMEDKFVKKVLEAPIQIQKRDLSMNATVDSQSSTPGTDSVESQSTVASTETATSAPSQVSTAATSFIEEPTVEENVVTAMQASPDVVQLQRIRVAFDFVCSNYIAPSIASHLRESLANEELSTIDFAPLEEYLAKLAKVRAEAMAARSASDFSRKRNLDEDEDEAREEKKRKLEEEKKRKANESRGVRELKKVNTKGMKKMSDFFKKK